MTTRSTTRQIRGSEDVSSVRDRYGNGDFLASVVGMLAALGTLVFISALLAAGAASIDFQLNLINAEGGLDETSIGGLLVAALIVFVSFLVGGFGAGRMARYSGGLNGLGAGLWALLLVAVRDSIKTTGRTPRTTHGSQMSTGITRAPRIGT